VNNDGKIAYANNQTEKLFGYGRSELIGQTVEVLIPPRYHERHPGFRQMFFHAPSVRAMGAGRELFALRKDRTEFPIEIGLNPLVTTGGTLILASIIDITERKKADERFRLVVNSAPNAMVLVNQIGKISLVNNEAKKLFGYEENEMIGNTLEMLIPARYRTAHVDFRNSFLSRPQTRPMGIGRELFALRKDQKEIPVEIGLNPIETADGIMVLASVIDITERKKQEEAIKRQVELEIKNRELEDFVYIASHDLQEPLRTMSNFAQALEEDYAATLDDNARKYVDAIGKAATRMHSLVRALLDFSLLGRNKKLVHTDCRKLVEETIADMADTVNSAGAVITVVDLPSLYVYETELRRLFQNLISNAIKFRKKEVPCHIVIDSQTTDDKCRMSVSDNGIGIDPKHFDRIFQIFQRLHSRDLYEGYGIGLPNCKKIVGLHGGEMWVESAAGAGSTFYFTIPNLQQ